MIVVRSLFALSLVFCFSLEAKPTKSIPLPASREARSKLSSVQEAFPRMYVSHQVPTGAGAEADAMTVSGREIADYEWAAMEDFIAGRGEFAWAKSAKAKNKQIWLSRYHLTDERIIEALLKAKDKGYGVVRFLTDLNDALVGKFRGSATITSDFAKAAYRDDDQGAAIRKLIEAGFAYNDDKYGIFSQPLYKITDPDTERKPIMHEKGLIFIVTNDDGSIKRAVSFAGTANLSIHKMTGNRERAEITRYNRMFQCVDPVVIAEELDHARRLCAAYAEGKESWQVETLPPLRVYYGKDEFIELAFSDGKYNPNDRIAELFERAAADPSFELKDVIFSHFVLTNTRVVKALDKAMKAQTKFNVYGIFDRRFASPKGFGLPAQLDGFDLFKPFGKLEYGVGGKLEARTDLFVYQRGIPGLVETDPSGPPTHSWVWHDKTTYIEVVEGGQRYVYIFTRSFNCSGNFHNAEQQIMMRVKADSPVALAVKWSIKGVVAQETEFAVEMPKGIFRMGIADLLGYNDIEIPVAAISQILDHVNYRRFAEVDRILRSILVKPSALDRRLDAETINVRIQRFLAFLDWHAGQFPHYYKTSRPIALRKLLSIAIILAAPEMKPTQAKAALRSAMWDNKNPDDEDLRLRRVRQAWELLGLEGEPPQASDYAPGGPVMAFLETGFDAALEVGSGADKFTCPIALADETPPPPSRRTRRPRP